MNKISTSPVLATPNIVQVVHAQYIRASNTPVYYGRRPSYHAIYCTMHAYTYSRRVVQRSSCTRRPPYTNTHTHTRYTAGTAQAEHRTVRSAQAQQKFWPYTRPVGSTRTSPGPVRVLYTCVPHSHAQTNTLVRSYPGPVRVLYTRVLHSHAQIHTPVRPYVHSHRHPRAVRSQMSTTRDTRGTARTFSVNTTPTSDRDRREIQTALDQCERLASKFPQLEGEHEVVADPVIGYDLAMAQNQPKLTTDWFTHRMSSTHTPVESASKKRAMQGLKDQRALGGKGSYQSISAWQQTVPTSPWYSPIHQPGWGGGPAYIPPPHAGWGGGTHTAPSPPPRLPIRALHSSHSRSRSWPGHPGRTGGCG